MAAAGRPARARPGIGQGIPVARHPLPHLLLGVPSMNPRKNLSGELADRLAGRSGKTYWRTLEELADSEAFQELMGDEFPEQASAWPDALSRRKFLTLM